MEITKNNSQETAITSKDNDLEKLMRKAAGPEFLKSLRLTYAVSEAFKNKLADVDDWMLGNLNLGKQVRIVIGPRRYTAMRLKDGNLDLISHNLTPNSKYNSITNDWEFPDGLQKDFLEIANKTIPDMGQRLINLIGFEHLLYFPDINDYGIYYLAKTAYTMTELKDIFKENKGKEAMLSTRPASSRNNSWSVPDLKIIANSTVTFPDTDESREAIEKFLNPGVVSTPNDTNQNQRPR